MEKLLQFAVNMISIESHNLCWVKQWGYDGLRANNTLAFPFLNLPIYVGCTLNLLGLTLKTIFTYVVMFVWSVFDGIWYGSTQA